MPGFELLNQACLSVRYAFGETPYLVGSSLKRRDHRDVDVRVILPEQRYHSMFANGGGQLCPFWSLLCSSISLQLGRATGLRVDFQVQSEVHAQVLYGSKPRVALAVFPDRAS